MTIQSLIEMVERRLAHLSQVRSSAAALGDIERVATLDADIAQAQVTLAQLKTLL